MKRVLGVLVSILALTMSGLSPAQAGGQQALAKGDGEVSTTVTQGAPTVYRDLCDVVTHQCFGQFPVATSVTVTETKESFSFSARIGPNGSSDTSSASGSMKVAYQSSATTTTTATEYYQFCNPNSGFYAPAGCPELGPSTVVQEAKATAEVTCLNVVQNRAAIGGHVVKFSGNFTPTRGLLFNGTDNTIARQQVAPDQFLGTFVTDVPQTCPPPGADAPITSGDVYVQQS